MRHSPSLSPPLALAPPPPHAPAPVLQVTLVGSDGRHYIFLAKPKDDLRKDNRMMEAAGVVNRLFAGDPAARRRNLYLRWVGWGGLGVGLGRQGGRVFDCCCSFTDCSCSLRQSS